MTLLDFITEVPLDAYQHGMPVLGIPANEIVAVADCEDEPEERTVKLYRRVRRPDGDSYFDDFNLMRSRTTVMLADIERMQHSVCAA